MSEMKTFHLRCACEQGREFPYSVKPAEAAPDGSTVVQIDCPYPWCKERLSVEIPLVLPADASELKTLQTRKTES